MDQELIEAAKNGNLEEVKVLLKNGANIHAYNDLALCWASENGHLEVVKVLLENGANVDVNNGHVIHLASYNGHLEIAEFLKSWKIKPKHKEVPTSIILSSKLDKLLSQIESDYGISKLDTIRLGIIHVYKHLTS